MVEDLAGVAGRDGGVGWPKPVIADTDTGFAMPIRACPARHAGRCCRRIWGPSGRRSSAPRWPTRTTRRIRIALGVPRGGRTSCMATPSRTKPTWTSSPASISTKGCYAEQESSRASNIDRARVAHRAGRLRIRAQVRPAGDGDKEIGTLVSAVRGTAWRCSELDRLADAQAAGLADHLRQFPIRVVKPDWANFAWPAAS